AQNEQMFFGTNKEDVWSLLFGEVRVAELALLIFTVLSGWRSRGVVITKFSACTWPFAFISFHRQAGHDCNQYHHLLWLPDCSGRKTEQCADRRGESSRGFGVDGAAGYRFEQARSGDRPVHSPSPPQRSQPKCSRLR